MRLRKVLVFLVPVLCLCPALGQEWSGTEKKEDKKDEEKPFEDVIKDMEKIEGLFTFYRKADENKVLLELPPGQFDRDYLYSAKIEQGTGERGLYGTLMMDEFVFQWRRLGKRIQFVQKNVRFRSQPGVPAERALQKSFADSILASGKVQSKPHPERNSVLVDLRDIFLAHDLHAVTQHLKLVYKTSYQFEKEDSGFVFLKSFPKNAEIGTSVRFRAQEYGTSGSAAVPDPRTLSLRFRYSLVALPENEYHPRLADDRVGHFLNMYMDFSDDRADTPYVRYVKRWHLVKKDPNAPLSEPLEPIVFWLENSIPLEYRDWFREGILMWNKAFEKIGFKNALVVRQQPDDADWDPADIRYNTVRWFVGYDASFAIGPSHSNPYTGQILDADIGMSEAILRLGGRRRYRLYIDPVQHLERLKGDHQVMLTVPGKAEARYLCNYAEGLSAQASLAYDLLAARPDWNPQKEKEFLRQYTMELTAHEVGHTLGLRHNFRASIINRLDQVADFQRSQSIGLGASVMDYNPAVIALQGEKQGDYFPTVVGSYDDWAIEYAYKPIQSAQTPEDERAELQKIASRAGDPLLPYGTDEDAGYWARALDPRTNHFDFTAEPLQWFAHEFKLVKELWKNMESKVLSPGDSYAQLRRSFDYSWNPYFLGAHTAMKYIGGIYHNRDHVGDPSGRPPFVPVAPAEQRRALQFLAEKVWAPDVFRAPADLLSKLQPERFWDFELSVFRVPRIDYPLHEITLFVQGEVLSDLYDPLKLARLQDLELMYPDPNDRFTMADLFSGIRNALWPELETPSAINSFRRNLQREHLKHLIKVLLEPTPNLPKDAVALARLDLVQLLGGTEKALEKGSNLDVMSRAHLQEAQALIKEALEAQLERSLK